MKLSNVYISLFLLAVAYIFMGHSAGRADSQNWGNTGAPGDQMLSNGTPRTCISCHGGSSISVDLDINILNKDGSELVDNEYIPGQAYDMSVIINGTAGATPEEYGFQMVALMDADEEEVNTWANPGSNVNIATASNTGRTYVEQNNSSINNTFTMEWTAPAAGSGDITFYSCGNGVNGNNSTSGDGAACTTLSLGEKITNSTFATLATIPFDVELQPNPTSDWLNVNIDSPVQENFTLNILSLNGQVLQTQEWSLTTAQNLTSLDVQDYATGMYFLQITNEKYNSTTKWIKQ